MVSLTFDEFHAIRSRQRATAEAETAAATAAAAAAASGSTQSTPPPRARNRPARSTTTRASVVANPVSRKQTSGASASSPSPPLSAGSSLGSHGGERDDEVAPTSGSVIREPQQRQQQAGNKPGKVTGPTSRWGGGLGLGSAANLGRFVELYEVQVAVVAMIYLDLVASTAQLLPYFQAAEAGPGSGAGDEGGVEEMTEASGGAGFAVFVLRLVSRFMQSFTGFTIILFTIEMVMLLAAFRGKIFRHAGYILDLFVVSLCLYQEVSGKGKGVRLLGALRVWRVARVMNTLLLSADEAHNLTRDTLRLAEKSTQDLDIDRRRLQETLRREVEARKRVDKMLRGYKDEVETLNEALKIAAMDIAAAAASAGKDTVGGGDEDALHDREKTSAGSDTGSSSMGSSEGGSVHESADGLDQKIPHKEQQRKGGSSSVSVANKIFVFQDGTFQAR
ncbi:unnamed protein product [Ectocarpus fasciculatus]